MATVTSAPQDVFFDIFSKFPVKSPDAIQEWTSIPRRDENVHTVAAVSVQCSMDVCVSPSKSGHLSISLDESMSNFDSFKSPEIEYRDNNEKTETDSIDEIVNVDGSYQVPQLCATIACDIYKNLRASEMKKRPSIDLMERNQKDINLKMRAMLVDWLVEVAEVYSFVSETLYLTVNYIDRYLSGNVIDMPRVQLLGTACMMIAAKYEEIFVPQVERFCYMTDNSYSRDEAIEMESTVLNYLKFELTAPTAKCFLGPFVRCAQGIDEAPPMQLEELEFLANYIAELSLLEYRMICYAPSMVAASAVFLAKYMLLPSKRPWNSTLQDYTLYEPVDLRECVKDLHLLCRERYISTLPAIREKYSKQEYKFVAKKYCPPSIPEEFFHNQSC